jgi:hypothetical protein
MVDRRIFLPKGLRWRCGCCGGKAHSGSLQSAQVSAFNTDPLEAIRLMREKLDVPTAS